MQSEQATGFPSKSHRPEPLENGHVQSARTRPVGISTGATSVTDSAVVEASSSPPETVVIKPMLVKRSAASGESQQQPPKIVIRRSSSAPSALEEPEHGAAAAGDSQRDDKMPSMPRPVAKGDRSTSMSGVDPTRPQDRLPMADPAATLHPSASQGAVAPPRNEKDFEEFINSPRGQNVIAERSPGGRYVRFMEKLGSGATKDVYRAYDTTEGIEVAWNVVQLAGVPKPERNRIVNEVRLLERLHHHNIISFHGSWVNREKQEVNFVTEILSSGTLKNFINKVQVIRWKIAKRWARQILNGLAYLHSQDPPVIHRDLKCDNIFINGTSGDLRIGDLGLSTVHRHGKVLSVLGTPEFMAPDLYEEAAYDEKVDIYAFGMCLLEIFTKEIPYRECSNPAQIYKKVLSNIPPESLGRLRSKEARDFIKLCLGYKDEATSTYVRPSAEELLKHPFLAKGADDDSEVEVDLPLRERVLVEEASVENGDDDVVESRRRSESAASGEGPATAAVSSPEEAGPSSRVPPVSLRTASQLSLEDDSDQFEEMPDSEVNIRKVKVLMGRGQELEESEESEETDLRESIRSSDTAASAAALEQSEVRSEASTGSRTVPSSVSQPVYCVAASVIEDESPLVRPYKDDILKLVIRLPVDGQTQNVQFDFHLVEDDAVQVAKEMVEELGIPPNAILEISETISAHARTARMKQDKYQRRQQEQMVSQGPPSVQQPGVSQQQPQQEFRQGQAPQQHAVQQQVTQQSIPPPQLHHQQQVSQQQVPLQQMPQQRVPPPQVSQQQMPHQQQVPSQQVSQQQMPQQQHQLTQQLVSEQQRHRESYQQQQQQMPPQQVSQQHLPQQQVAQQQMQQQQQQVPPQQMAHFQTSENVPQQHAPPQHQPSAASIQGMQSNGNLPPQPQTGSMATQHHLLPPLGQAVPHGDVYQQQARSMSLQEQRLVPQQTRGVAVQDQAVHAVQAGDYTGNQTTQSRFAQGPAQQLYGGISQVPSGGGEFQVGPTSPCSLPPGERAENGHQPYAPAMDQHAQVHPKQPVLESSSHNSHEYNELIPSRAESYESLRSSTELKSASASSDSLREDRGDDVDEAGESSDDESDEGDEISEELRRLDEDFQKNLQRAKRVFDSRMDNLQRSKEEKEAQHLKTLEKHEKERAEFEKRVRQAEKEQTRRIEQLQREWDKKREKLAKNKRKHSHDGEASSVPTSPVQTEQQPPQSAPPISSLALFETTDEAGSVAQEEGESGRPR